VQVTHLHKLAEYFYNLKRLALYFIVEGCENILPHVNSPFLEHVQLIQTYEADTLGELVLIDFCGR
jgi:hypothetical protein